jgi:CheY-like chemotaxis protein
MYGPRILVVEDEACVRTLFQRILEEAGYSTTGVDTVRQALRELDDCSYDAVVTDLSLPDMDGFDLLKTTRRDNPHIKVLVVSGVMGGDLLKIANALGAHATLDKLLASEFLLPTVCRMLDDEWNAVRGSI